MDARETPLRHVIIERTCDGGDTWTPVGTDEAMCDLMFCNPDYETTAYALREGSVMDGLRHRYRLVRSASFPRFLPAPA
jgi:hypothetical protein